MVARIANVAGHGRGLAGPQRVDAQQECEGAVVHADGLGDLEETDQLQPVQALGARLVSVDLRQPRIHRGVGGMRPSM